MIGTENFEMQRSTLVSDENTLSNVKFKNEKITTMQDEWYDPMLILHPPSQLQPKGENDNRADQLFTITGATITNKLSSKVKTEKRKSGKTGSKKRNRSSTATVPSVLLSDGSPLQNPSSTSTVSTASSSPIGILSKEGNNQFTGSLQTVSSSSATTPSVLSVNIGEVSTDVTKSFHENVENRFQHWKKVEKLIADIQEEVARLKEKVKVTPDIPECRPNIASWKASILELESRIVKLRRSNNQVEYLHCVAKVILETEAEASASSNTTDTTSEPDPKRLKSSSGSNNNVAQKRLSSSQQFPLVPNTAPPVNATIRVAANGPLKPHPKKKKLPNQNRNNNGNIFTVTPINFQLSNLADVDGNELFVGKLNDKAKSSRRLAEALHEVPLEFCEISYCPTCITVVMQFNERPPSLFCSSCGLSIEDMDHSTSLSTEKETTNNNNNSYRPRMHFVSWVKRITGKLRFNIPSWVMDEIYYRLSLRKIDKVDDVTWEVIDNIVRTSSKTDSRFTDYYPHVYQITNVIRGKALLDFTPEEEQEIFEYFDPIFILWESKKHLFQYERSNFMYNALVLQIIFMILNYPPSVIKIFNAIKGDSNLRFYDSIIRMLCKELDEKPFTTSELEVMKYGKAKDIVETLKTWKFVTEEEDDEIEDSTTSSKCGKQQQKGVIITKTSTDDDTDKYATSGNIMGSNKYNNNNFESKRKPNTFGSKDTTGSSCDVRKDEGSVSNGAGNSCVLEYDLSGMLD